MFDDGGDDSAFVLVIHAAAKPLVDDVPIPDEMGNGRKFYSYSIGYGARNFISLVYP